MHYPGIVLADVLPRDINRYVLQGIVFADTLPRDSINRYAP